MLRRFLRRYVGWAVIFSTGMTLLIAFRPWNPSGPLITSPIRMLVTFLALFLSQLGIQALVDPEVGAKIMEKLKNMQARQKARQKARRERLDKRHDEAKRRLREAWKELRGEKTRKL